VRDSDIQRKFFSSQPSTSFPVPELDQPEGNSYTQYPHAKLSLPTEEYIGLIVRGEAKGSGNYALTTDDVFRRLKKECNNKVGLKEKVEEVLARKTTKAEDGTLKWIYDD
jgi:3-hydroxyisobutyryl-CoA hydrolase